ncbi:SCO family protein, partial [Mesorhizobium sp. M7D.F.Ca.US.004.03.1.1]
MMRSILVGILVLMAAGIGWLTFDWYRGHYGGEPFGAAFTLVDQKGAPITEAAFRGQPSVVFFGFTHCPEVCPTTLFELAGWLK